MHPPPSPLPPAVTAQGIEPQTLSLCHGVGIMQHHRIPAPQPCSRGQWFSVLDSCRSQIPRPPVLLACAGVEGGPWRHSFTQTFKLPSEIAPCVICLHRHREPAQRSKSWGRGLGRSSSCLSVLRRVLESLGSLEGGCPVGGAGCAPVLTKGNSSARRRERLGLRAPAPLLTPEGTGGYSRMYLGSGSQWEGVKQAEVCDGGGQLQLHPFTGCLGAAKEGHRGR